MNCYECAQSGLTTPAVAVCHDCGAGVCPDHASPGQHTLTVVRATNTRSPVDPPQRRIWCRTCAAAIDAANESSAARRDDRTVSASTGPRR
ncbi:MAG: DUF2180 family protein [Acidimicrobiia bacterium]